MICSTFSGDPQADGQQGQGRWPAQQDLGKAPASGHFVSVRRLSPGEDVQTRPVVGAGHQHGIALQGADPCTQALCPAACARYPLVQSQAQEPLCVLNLAQYSTDPVCDQVDNLHQAEKSVFPRSAPWSAKSEWQSRCCLEQAGHAVHFHTIRCALCRTEMLKGKPWIDSC